MAMTIFASGAVLFGAAILYFVLNDYRLHRKEYDGRDIALFTAIAAGGICSAASGLAVLL